MHLRKRACGIHLHITSLPSNFGVGDLGPRALEFVDLLGEAHQNFWGILPVTPTLREHGDSPYLSSSSFAGNTLLISPVLLEEEGLLKLPNGYQRELTRVDYRLAHKVKDEIIGRAFQKFQNRFQDYKCEFEAFCSKNDEWLEDYALYTALKDRSSKPWYLWPPPLRDREEKALKKERENLKEAMELESFAQFIFFRQWSTLKEHCRDRGIKVIGDLPFYVNHDSADAWIHPEIFKLDEEKHPLFVSGVPPDYFSDTGQLWGTPVYDWEHLKSTGFKWWIERIQHQLSMVDVLRLDHFRGFSAYWQVPSEAKTAEEGSWVEVPTDEFFDTLARYCPMLPFISEDLGDITPEVREDKDKLGIPGMKVLVFAFGGSPDNPYLPHNHSRNSVVLTGTHDTNTARGWFSNASSEIKNNFYGYIGRKISGEEVSWELVRVAMSSVANLSILPLQDILSLGSEARMNHPTKGEDNWRWRVTADQFIGKAWIRLKEMTEIYGRS
ncbi:MAG: 4-alpha-glucanotransferase [Thermoproteota archaeon]